MSKKAPLSDSKKTDYDNRVTSFRDEMKLLCEKHRLDVRAGLKYLPDALVPVVVFVDVREHYEQVVKDQPKKD